MTCSNAATLQYLPCSLMCMCFGNSVMLKGSVCSWKHEWKNLEDINHIDTRLIIVLKKIIFSCFEVQQFSVGLPLKGIWRHKKQWYQQSTDSLQSGTGRYWHDSIECCCHSCQYSLLLVSLMEKRVSFFFVLSELLELANLLGSTRLLKPPTKQPEVFPSCWICTKWEIRCTM